MILFCFAFGVAALVSGCTGSIMNKEKNCSYDYLLHPEISISKIIGGCGPAEK
ncbi:TPA: DUF4223 domain-containing protein [Enterobacter cloacae]|nr:DUF4223 domain-containing protein [Enterobacter cloacae]